MNPGFPHYRLAQQDEGPRSRNRLWNLRLVFWTFLWQIAQAGASCREAIDQARSQRQRRELLDELFRGIAADLLPDRLGRREPRAVKRRPKPYPRLMCHRSKFKEIQHQNRYYKNSPYGQKPRRSSRA